VPEWDHQQRSTSLAGTWLVTRADEARRRTVADRELDTSDWAEAPVPGHWRDADGLHDADAVLYRHRFETARARGRRRWLSIDGLCYQGDIWLDGAYLGATEGYFAQHVFDVTDLLDAGSEHLLAIEATCSHPGDRLDKRNITGVLQHSDILDDDINPGGLWRDVRIEETGPVRIDDLQVLALEADTDRAILRFRATLDSAATHRAQVITLVDPASDNGGSGAAAHHLQELVLAKGRNEVEWHVAVESPELWWPRALGPQPLYDVRVTVSLGDEVSHVRKRRTGLRTFELRNWIAAINGERLFLKGSNLGPTSIDLAATTPAHHRRDLAMATTAGLDLLRIHGHIAAPDLYREADRIGMLLWQDFPLQWGHSRSIRREAMRQADLLVTQLGHHPSVVIWSGHNEPGRVAHRPGHRIDAEAGHGLRRSVWAAQSPSWNRSIIDRSVQQTLRSSDPTRPTIAHSGVAPHLPKLDGTDSHLYLGWRSGRVDDIAAVGKRMPRLIRFVSEFGAQALPDDETIEAALAEEFPNIDCETLARLGGQLDLLAAHTPPADSPTWSDWVEATQKRQAHVIRHTIEMLRVLKYRPTGGFCQFLLADAMPFVTPSVLDHERRPKLGWHALVAACRPVIAVADLHADSIATGAHSCVIHVVSDLRTDIGDSALTVRWQASGAEERSWEFGGRFDADSVSRVARIRLAAPESGTGRLTLSLQAKDLVVDNSYEVDVTSRNASRRA